MSAPTGNATAGMTVHEITLPLVNRHVIGGANAASFGSVGIDSRRGCDRHEQEIIMRIFCISILSLVAVNGSAETLFPMPSVPDVTDAEGWAVGLGAGLEYEAEYDGSDEYGVEAEPVFIVQRRGRNHMWFLEGQELGWRGRLADVCVDQHHAVPRKSSAPAPRPRQASFVTRCNGTFRDFSPGSCRDARAVPSTTVKQHRRPDMADHTKDWPSLAAALYDKLTQRNAEITYEAENVEVWVPSGIGEDAEHAKWKLNGTMKIRARDGVTG